MMALKTRDVFSAFFIGTKRSRLYGVKRWHEKNNKNIVNILTIYALWDMI